MKFKKHFLIYLVIISFCTSFTWISSSSGDPHLASPDIKWNIIEGGTYTWVVRESNTNLGFLPVNSKYAITIDAIISLGGGEASQIDVTMTTYNSQTQITTTIFNNGTFTYFDSAIDYVSFYAPFYDHGFFAPSTDYLGFRDGLEDYLYDYCGFDSIGSQWSEERLLSIDGTIAASDLYYLWEFNINSVTDRLSIAYTDDLNTGVYQYLLELERAIPFGNLYLVFTGLTIISLIYVYRKKTK